MVHSGLKASIPTEQEEKMTAPRRVQLSRARGWRMPENTVKVDRSTRFGNPWSIGSRDHNNDLVEDAGDAVAAFRAWVEDMADAERIGERIERLSDWRSTLRGKNLASWCKLDGPCHADVLLELANKDTPA